jgi:hypothetical protein
VAGPEDVEPFRMVDVIALVLVLVGFVVYSALEECISRVQGQGEKKRLPIQFAAGSMMYMRERSNSDPSTPGYTPIKVRNTGRWASLTCGQEV